ncbi:MAG: hypothetical protein F6K09_35280, partial [Merismopedia sp. SIO2A8]|nr:hypothetical protein [Merismopedia sp. SIO2A8]
KMVVNVEYFENHYPLMPVHEDARAKSRRSWFVYSGPTVILESSIVEIGKHFFSDFLLPFELASVLLLMAMVGAIILARRDYIPEQLIPRDSQIKSALTLPERPRELASVGSDSQNTPR